MSNSVESKKLIEMAFNCACVGYSPRTIKGFRHFIDKFDETLRRVGLAGAKLKLIIEFPNSSSQEPPQNPPQVEEVKVEKVEVELDKLIKEFLKEFLPDKPKK